MASRVAISRTPRVEVRLTPPSRARAPRSVRPNILSPIGRDRTGASRAPPAGCGRRPLIALAVDREAEVDAAVARVEPAGSDHLAPGVEVDAFGAVHVRVTEQRGLPAAEGVV